MQRVIIDNKIRHGKPVIKGTRITVDEILGALVGGMSYTEIKKEYGVTDDDIRAAIEYAASVFKGEEIRQIKTLRK
ncbi:MAG: DUF433 domain-containing protein [Candidatus Aenigmarchaeota archaeon]|nr:DUF433 domain-containing protein [Candidatus Aenigmarchaeota archaeon]